MNYIEAILSGSMYENEILKHFLLDPLPDKVIAQCSENDLNRVAEKIFSLLVKTPVEVILDILEAESNNLRNIKPANIPQFSQIDDMDVVLDILASGDVQSYAEIGYHFKNQGNRVSWSKYGENHYKLASCLALANPPKKKMYHLTFLGKKYRTLSREKRVEVRDKLVLLVPVVQRILIIAKHQSVNVFDMLREHVSESTATRRKSNVYMLLDCALRKASIAFSTEVNYNIDRS